MKKNLFIILIVFILFFPLYVFSLDVDFTSKSAIAVNRNNKDILFELNKDEILPVASLTKLMTVIVSIENIEDFNKMVEVDTSYISNLEGYTILGLKDKDIISYNDLLYSTMLKSAADSANTLAYNVFDNYMIFINKMNELAKKIGMNNTHFSNPIGMDNDNYSTSYDLYLLLDYALNNEKFYDIYTTQKYNLNYQNITIKNSINNVIKKNNLYQKRFLYLGSKTGFTTLSGLSFSGLSKIDNNEIISITIGSTGEYLEYNHLKDNLSLLNNINDTYSNRLVLKKNVLVDNLVYKVKNNKFNYKVFSTKDHYYFMNNNINLNYLKIYYNGKVLLNKQTKENTKIGTISVYYNDEVISNEDVYFNKKNIEYKVTLLQIIIVVSGLIVVLLIFIKIKS